MTDIATITNGAYRKTNRHILPITMVAFALALWDRSNVSLAALQMNADIGLSATAFGLGAGLFYALYVFLEVPSNVILARVGARLWISRIMITWGLVTLLTAFIQNETQFYIARVLLGVVEAGLVPGMIYYLSTWYPDGRRGRALSIYGLGAVLTPLLLFPLSGWILEWNTELPAWRWMFIVSGVITMLFAFVVFWFLPDSPKHARWLTDAERDAMAADHVGAEKTDHSMRAQWAALKVVFSRPGLLGMALVLFIILSTGWGLTTFTPTILSGYEGMTPFLISICAALPALLAVGAILISGRIADRTRKYAFLLIGLFTIAGVGYALLYPGRDSLVMFIVGSSAIAFLGACYPVPVWAMVTGALERPAQAAAVIALINSIGVTGGFFGPYLFGVALDASGGAWESTIPWLIGAMVVAILLVAVIQLGWSRRKIVTAPTTREVTTTSV